MNYIKRDLENKIVLLSEEYACVLVTGPRQVGKTTLLRNLMTDNRNYVTLDVWKNADLPKTTLHSFWNYTTAHFN